MYITVFAEKHTSREKYISELRKYLSTRKGNSTTVLTYRSKRFNNLLEEFCREFRYDVVYTHDSKVTMMTDS